MSRIARIFILPIALVIANSAGAQAPQPADSAYSVKNQETSYAERPFDTTRAQNPTAALFKSMFVPGWGQICNKKYIKAGVVISLESIFIANLVHYARKTSDAKKAFDAATDDALLPDLYAAYRSAKDDRNLYSWFTGTVIFISMFDAYVDAHLAHFPKISDNISLNIAPTRESDLAVNLCLIF